MKGMSAVDAIINLIQFVSTAVDGQEQALLLDLSNACHFHLLFNELKMYGVNDLPLEWLKSNRKQMAQVENYPIQLVQIMEFLKDPFWVQYCLFAV